MTAVSITTLQARLDRCDLAIQRIEESLTQEHETQDRRHRAPNLETLYKQRERLQSQIDALSAGSARMRGIKIV